MSVPVITFLQSAALALIAGLVIALQITMQSHASTAQEGPLIVLATPWSDPVAAIRASGGTPVGPERALFGVLAASQDPTFQKQMTDRGFWAFRSGTLAGFLCGVRS